MFSKILSDRRRAIGMSIDQLVTESGVPKGTVTKILTGKSANPSLENVKAIAYALGLSLNDVFDDRNTKLSERAYRIAMTYDALSDIGKELLDQTAAFAEKNFKKF